MSELEPRPRRAASTSLIDLLDRVLDGGAYVGGDVIIALAGIDLLRIDLRVLLAPIEGALAERATPGARATPQVPP